MVKSSKKKKVKKVKEPKPFVDPLQNYDIKLRTHERRAVLQIDSQQWGALKVMKQLNQVRESHQWNPRVHDIISKDLEFLEKEYQREKQKLKIKS